MAEAAVIIRRFTLTDSAYTAIVAPSPCSYFAIYGNADGTPLLRCSDPTNNLSWYEMLGGYTYALVGTHTGTQFKRFNTGDVLTYLQRIPGNGSGIVIIEFD